MEKKFDCVEMKDAIQRKLSLRRKGMSGRAIQSEMEKELEWSRSPIARYWRDIRDGEVLEHRDRSLVKC